MQKFNYHHFHNELFNVDFLLFAKTKEKDVLAFILENYDLEILDSGPTRGWMMFHPQPELKRKTIFIWLEDNKFNLENLETLAHELIHAKNKILDYVEATRRPKENDEFEAYFYDWMFKKAASCLKGAK